MINIIDLLSDLAQFEPLHLTCEKYLYLFRLLLGINIIPMSQMPDKFMGILPHPLNM